MSSSSDKFPDGICAMRKWNGDPCQSPALNGERFCHYHKVMGEPKVDIDNGPSHHVYLHVFEDAVSIQSAISDVCEMLLHRRIEAKEASVLLYAMQVASTNMAHMNSQRAQRKLKSQKKSSAETSPIAAPPSSEASNASSAASSPEPDPLPPGTIQACQQEEAIGA
ncbi:MAG: hypothetical protein ACLPLR_01650 [Terriglobales bacterium]